MEKKSGREKTGGGWQNRYFVIRSPGVLYQYKKADMSGPPLQTLDLARVLSVVLHTTKVPRHAMPAPQPPIRHKS